MTGSLSIFITGMTYILDQDLFIDTCRAVDAREDTFSYGLFMGAGTSSQNQSLWPSIVSNETRMASNNFCVTGSPYHCADPTFTHGHFGADASATWQTTPQYASLDIENSIENATYTFGKDSLNIFTHYYDPSPPTEFVLQDHPITTVSNYVGNDDVFFKSGHMGLGAASTLLSQLVDVGRIQRKVFGMYLGTAYPRAGGSQNGSLVLGGFDAGRLHGEPHKYTQSTMSSDSPTPFKVHVKQMSLVTTDGTSIGLVTDKGFDGYISTDQYAMEFPADITKILAEALHAQLGSLPDATLQAAQPFNGNFTIVLDDGYNITYPSEWITNTSNATPFAASAATSNISSSNMPLIFGTAFLHHLYMTVDYDDSVFYLADAQVANSYVMPQALCDGMTPVAIAAPRTNKFVQSGLIGAVLGGLIGGLGIAFALFFVLRKRLQARRSKKAIDKMEQGDSEPSPPYSASRARFGILKLGLGKRWKKDRSASDHGPAKRLSSDSERSVQRNVSFTLPASKEKARISGIGIELDNLKLNEKSKAKETSVKFGLQAPIASTRPEPGVSVVESAEMAPQGEVNTYAITDYPITPGTANIITPRTGNPLLGDFRQHFTNFDDHDDSDLPAQHRHQSHHLKRISGPFNRKRLSIGSSGMISGQLHNATLTESGRTVTGPRQKPVPLPLKIVGQIGSAGSGLERGCADMSPTSLRSENSQASRGTRHSILRKMFPAS